jgi:hypothetical protein
MIWVLVFLGFAVAVMMRHRAHEHLKRRPQHELPRYANDESVINVKDQHLPQPYKKRILRA